MALTGPVPSSRAHASSRSRAEAKISAKLVDSCAFPARDWFYCWVVAFLSFFQAQLNWCGTTKAV